MTELQKTKNKTRDKMANKKNYFHVKKNPRVRT